MGLHVIVFFFFLCGQKEETRKNREHAPPSNKWAFRCLAAELAASPLKQSSPETTPKSLICYRRLPLSFAPLTPRLLSRKTCEGVWPLILVRTAPLPFTKGRGWGWGCISLIFSSFCVDRVCGLKGQQAHSPRQRLGYQDVHIRPEGA